MKVFLLISLAIAAIAVPLPGKFHNIKNTSK
jgi:hypothetical protein